MENKLINVYAAKLRDESERLLSQSGGIFVAISDWVLDKGGVVYGCILTDDFKAKHIRASDKNTRDLMRGSKYIQSQLGDVFSNVKLDLQEGKLVLFSGTSCQVSGLRNFLGKKYNNLLCVDIICHGTPSPSVWLKYLDWQKKEQKKK